MLIRRATDTDAHGVAGIQVRGWHKAYSDIMPSDRLAAMNVAARIPIWEELLAKSVTFVSEVDKEITGFCSVGAVRDDDLDNSKVGEICALYVEPTLWRRGIGQQLCASGLSWLKDQGYETASLWVLEENLFGRSFYEKLGFTPDGKKKLYQAGDIELSELRYFISL